MCEYYRATQEPDTFVDAMGRPDYSTASSPTKGLWAGSPIVANENVSSPTIGERANAMGVMHRYAIVQPKSRIGRNTTIGSFCFIEGGAVIGEGCTIKSHVSVYKGVTIKNRVFVGDGVAFINDSHCRAWLPCPVEKTVIEEGVTIGANATILPVTLGRYAFIGAGAVVTKDVQPYYLMVGNPAVCMGYVCRNGHRVDWKLAEEMLMRHGGEIPCECRL
jgi:UDP-2-acetamido-3-amino-2,3-dideoxy-glucuronate N-acetyltransferase